MPFYTENEYVQIYKWLSSVDNITAQDLLLTVSRDLSSASNFWWFLFVMLILKVSLERIVTVVLHKETEEIIGICKGLK